MYKRQPHDRLQDVHVAELGGEEERPVKLERCEGLRDGQVDADEARAVRADGFK